MDNRPYGAHAKGQERRQSGRGHQRGLRPQIIATTSPKSGSIGTPHLDAEGLRAGPGCFGRVGTRNSRPYPKLPGKTPAQMLAEFSDRTLFQEVFLPMLLVVLYPLL
jgi:hypothetical protein